jgi:hypothetical protein
LHGVRASRQDQRISIGSSPRMMYSSPCRCQTVGSWCKPSQRVQLDLAHTCGPRCTPPPEPASVSRLYTTPTPTWTRPPSRASNGYLLRKSMAFFADFYPPQTFALRADATLGNERQKVGRSGRARCKRSQRLQLDLECGPRCICCKHAGSGRATRLLSTRRRKIGALIPNRVCLFDQAGAGQWHGKN